MNQKMTQAGRPEKNEDFFRGSNFDKLNNYSRVMPIKQHKKYFDIGLKKHLLFDDALVYKKQGFVLNMNPAIRMNEPVLTIDQPWEIGGIAGDSNMTVMDDEGVYKLWYVVKKQESKTNIAAIARGANEIDRLDQKTLADFAAPVKYLLCYATSEDGINWNKPVLGISEHNGSHENNIVFEGRLGCTVFKDPSASPEERYKLIYGGGGRMPHVHLSENDIPMKKIYHAIYGASSPDGIHWKPYKKPIIPWYTDTTNVCYWDEQIKKYVAFVPLE